MPKSLGEKWLKLCDDFISNEVVHIDKELVNRSATGRAVLVESYVTRNFKFNVLTRLTCRHGHSHNYRVMFEHLEGSLRGRGLDNKSLETSLKIIINPGNFEGHLMFVLIRDFVQAINRVRGEPLSSIVSIEWLQLSNQINCPCWELRQDGVMIANPGIESLGLWRDGEFCTVNGKFNPARRAFPDYLGKTPYQVIQNRTKFSDTGSDRCSQVRRDILQHNESITNYLGFSINLFLADYSVRMALEKPVGFNVEILDVLPCSIESTANLWHVVSGPHMLYSQSGREENGQTKNSTRVRDTRTQAKGRVRRTRKGGETDQASSSPPPPEEVKSRTVPYHHHGGYTAKHTHSGNLEDV